MPRWPYLLDLLEALDAGDAEALVLRDVQGSGYQEIARLIEVPAAS